MSEVFEFRDTAVDSPAYSTYPAEDVLGGYISPEGMLKNDDQINEVRNAITTLNDFLDQAIKKQVLIFK